MSQQQDLPFQYHQLTVLVLAPMQGASTTGKASQGGKTSNKKAAAAPARKKKPVVLSSGSESEEEEEGPSSEDEAESLEIERVLHGRPNPDTKQEEFLVKLKGDNECKSVAIHISSIGFLLKLVVSKGHMSASLSTWLLCCGQ